MFALAVKFSILETSLVPVAIVPIVRVRVRIRVRVRVRVRIRVGGRIRGRARGS